MEKRSAKQRKSREEGETKGRETSGQLDLPAIPNKTERGNEFTRISKKSFYSSSNLFRQNIQIIVTGVSLIKFIAKKQRSSLP